MTKASASVGRAAILAASALTRHTGTLHEPCSPLTRQRAHDHTRVSGNTTRAQPCSGKGASLGARALCALLGRAPLLTSLRASLERFKRSRACSGSVRMPAAHTQPGPASRRENKPPTSLRAPRVARRHSPRSALRASLGRLKRSRAGSGSVRQEACGAHACSAAHMPTPVPASPVVWDKRNEEELKRIIPLSFSPPTSLSPTIRMFTPVGE